MKSNTTGVITATESGPGAASNTAIADGEYAHNDNGIAPLTSTAAIGQSANFTITVTDTDSGPGLTPTGTVAVSSASVPSNTDSISACTLAQTVVGTATCQVTVTPTTPTGTHTLSASFTATDIVHANSSTTTGATLTVTNPATTTQVTSSHNPSTYGDSVTFTATVSSDAGTPTGSVEFHEGACGGTLLAGPTGLNGSGQAVFITAALNADLPYYFCLLYATGVFLASYGSVSQTVDQATPTVTVSGGPFTYNGTQHEATVTVTGVGGATVSGATTVTYDGSAMAPTNAKATPYAVSVMFTSSDPNYTNATGSGSIVINKAPSTTEVTGGTFTFDGAAHPAMVSVTGAGGLSLTPSPVYSGSCSAAPVNVADTPCTASYMFAGDDNHNGSSGSAVITITKAPSVTTIGAGYTVIYNALPHGVTANVTGAGGLNQAVPVVYTPGGSSAAEPRHLHGDRDLRGRRQPPRQHRRPGDHHYHLRRV